MAKLKNTDKVPESGVSNPQETQQEIDISPNTSTDAQTITTTDSTTDTVSDSATELESKGTTTSDTGREDKYEPEIIAPQPSEKDKLSTQKGSKKSYQKSPDNFTMEVLKAHCNYETLYVNKLGCAYTSDTPEAIRGSAVLYKNPHFKPE